MEDPDFPRIAITYSLEENSRDSSVQQEEMQKIIEEYNQYFDTAWSLADIERYNGRYNAQCLLVTRQYQNTDYIPQ